MAAYCLLSLLSHICEGRSKAGIKSKRMIHWFEDFYIEPAFRNSGTARKLAEAAQSWCRENDIASLTVCCAACDEAIHIRAGKSRIVCSDAAHAHGTIAALGHEECNSPLSDGLLKLLLLDFCK